MKKFKQFRCNVRQIREWEVVAEAYDRDDFKKLAREMVCESIGNDCAGMEPVPGVNQHQKYYEDIEVVNVRRSRSKQ